jgi:hypothetical protein
MRTLFAFACAAWLLLASGPSGAQTPNACGCYQDANGCKCNRSKAKCGCPGECEPVGCEAKREKQAEKAASAELRRIAAREKKLAADAAKAAREKDKVDKAAVKARLKETKDKPARPASDPLKLLE